MYKKRWRSDVVRSTFRSTSSKKGQITVFIILGMVILIALVLALTFQREAISFKPEEIIPTEKGKVASFISFCIQNSGEEALQLIGLQGGYIEVPEEILADGTRHLKTSPFTAIPLWAQGNSVTVPSLSEMKSEIDNYLEQNLASCLFSSEVFKESYDIIEKSSVKADTRIVDNKVIFNVNWDLEVRDKGGKRVAEIINHVAESPIKLKQLHELANEIIGAELRQMKLEDITQDLLALEHPNVPLAGTELSCTRKVWEVEEVKEQLKELLRVNIGNLRLKGTDFLEFPDELPYYKSHYIWDIGNDFINPKISAIFNYQPTYPFTFQVTPLKNGKMTSGQVGGTDILSFICVQNWKFTYDVVYPVAVSLKEGDYNFNFAFDVHLIRNIPNREVQLTARPSNTLNFVADESYCKQARIPMTITTWELVENKRGVSNREPLDDVNLAFSCIKNQCDAGRSEFDFANRGYQAGQELNLPYCVGGIVRGKKEGYKEGVVRVVTTPGEEVEVNLIPLKQFPLNRIKVIKHELGDLEETSEWRDETLSIKLVFNKEDGGLRLPLEPFHEENVIISSQLDEEVVNSQTLDFLAKANFAYELELLLFNEDQIVGGYRGNWTVPWSNLEEAEELTFHVVSKENANEDDLFDLVLNLNEYSQQVPLPEIR